MHWPRFLRRQAEGGEQRADYTSALISALVAQAEDTADVTRTAALEIASGLWARGFASATVTGTDAVTPDLLALIGRSLIRNGELVAALALEGGALELQPASSWDVHGARPSESSWTYRLDMHGPTDSEVRIVPAAGVVHFRYAASAARPWEGIPPLTWANTTGRLAAALELRMSQEAATPGANIVPVPSQISDQDDDDDDPDPLSGLRDDLLAAKGSFTLVESQIGGWGEPHARGGPRGADWGVTRLGASIPPANVELRRDLLISVLGVCGIPPSLAVIPADGTGQREAFRRFLHATLAPVARTVAAELSVKLETEVSLTFPELGAADVSGRARAFQSLVGAGVAEEVARELTQLNT